MRHPFLFTALAALATPLLHAGLVSTSLPTAAYLGQTTLLPVTAPPQSFVTSISDGALEIDFSVLMDVDTVPDSWATWGSPPNTESPTPTVLAPDDGPLVTGITLQFSAPLDLFGVELEPDDTSASHLITANYFLGANSVGTLSLAVDGNGGARLFAAGGAVFDSVTITSDVNFAAAQFRYSLAGTGAPVPEPRPLWLLMVPCAVITYRRVAQRSKSSAR